MKLKSLLLSLLCLFLFCGTGWGATWYTKVDPVNGATKVCYSTTSFDAACTENSNKTFADLVTAITAGDTIELSGGSSGATYEQAINLTKACNFNASTASGHNGTITLDTKSAAEGIDFHHTSGTVTINGPFYHTYVYQEDCGAGQALLFRSGGNPVIINNYHLVKSRAATWAQHVNSANVQFNYSSIQDIGVGDQLYNNATTATYTFNYCLFRNCYLNFAGTLNLNNSILIRQTKKRDEHINVLATGVLNSKNNVYLGGQIPVNSTTGSTVNSTSDYYETTNFDDAGLCTPVNRVTNFPDFVNMRDGSGEVVIAVDDMIADAYNFASDPAVIASGIKMSFAYPANANTWTATTIDYLRYFINNGHEVATHNNTHSGMGNLNCGFSLSATGTSPTITITGTRSGDSSTWTGTLRITINGQNLDVDLANASYDTMGELFTYLKNKTVGDGTISVPSLTPTDSKAAILKSLTLADVSAQSISASYIPQLDETAFIRFEAIEAILDLQARVNTGSDRNGNGTVTGMTQPAPSPAYVCHIFRTANGQGRVALETALRDQGTVQIYGGTAIGTGTATTDIWAGGVNAYQSNYPINMYRFPYINATDALYLTYVKSATVSPGRVWHPLYHEAPTYGGTIQGLVDLFNQYGLKGVRLEDVITRVTDSGNWTACNTNYWCYTGSYGAYAAKGDFRLKSPSPFINAGVNICTGVDTPLVGCTGAGTGTYTDYAGKAIRGLPDIGAYEFYPSGGGGGAFGRAFKRFWNVFNPIN